MDAVLFLGLNLQGYIFKGLLIFIRAFEYIFYGKCIINFSFILIISNVSFLCQIYLRQYNIKAINKITNQKINIISSSMGFLFN